MTQPQTQTRTQQDQYNHLLAVAFEERVNAQTIARALEERLNLATQTINNMAAELEKANAQISEYMASLPKAAPADVPAQG